MKTFDGYELTDRAVLALSKATTAGAADDVFDTLAPYVPARDRPSVWVVIPAALGLHPKELAASRR